MRISLLTFLFIFIFLLIVLTIFLYIQYNNLLSKISEAQKTAKQSVSPYPTLPITTPDEANAPSSQSYSIDSGYASTYQQVKTVPFKITIPSNYENLEPWNVSISTLSDLRNFYATTRKEGCPGPCSILIEN